MKIGQHSVLTLASASSYSAMQGIMYLNAVAKRQVVIYGGFDPAREYNMK